MTDKTRRWPVGSPMQDADNETLAYGVYTISLSFIPESWISTTLAEAAKRLDPKQRFLHENTGN